MTAPGTSDVADEAPRSWRSRLAPLGRSIGAAWLTLIALILATTETILAHWFSKSK